MSEEKKRQFQEMLELLSRPSGFTDEDMIEVVKSLPADLDLPTKLTTLRRFILPTFCRYSLTTPLLHS